MKPAKTKMVPKMVNKIPRMVPAPTKKRTTVAWNPNIGKTGMMKKVRKSSVPASKKAGLIRQIAKNKA